MGHCLIDDKGQIVDDFRFDAETERFIRQVVIDRTGQALASDQLRGLERAISTWRHVYSERERLKPRAKQIRRELQRAVDAKDVETHYKILSRSSHATQHEVMMYASHRWKGRVDYREAAADALKYLYLPKGRRGIGARRSLVMVLIEAWVSIGGSEDDSVWDNTNNLDVATQNASPLAKFLSTTLAAVEGRPVDSKTIRAVVREVHRHTV